VFLLKDRGRDGRILIGAGDDVHVRVPKLDGEIAVFANKSGQIRVRFPGGGTLDGRPFSTEEPISAGAVVECGGVSFVLIPWTK